ncbi:hypothetical protein KBB25_03460 [Candidatus Gracilibacteria bacterium]|nr:hypothetical protein [Candidatus Gracilibacteria bacterium]
MLTHYLKTYTSELGTIPTIMDEEHVFECVRTFSHEHITSLDDCITGNIPNVYLYEKAEDKKHLSISDIRRWISDVSEKPYEGKALYILRDFDEATSDAMNASLKILEEPPEYAIIILEVKNPEAIIETIRSRTITFFRDTKHIPLSEEMKEAIKLYFSEDIGPLLSILHKGVSDDSEAISVLMESLRYANTKRSQKIEDAIIQIFHVNESTRNILDRVFL